MAVAGRAEKKEKRSVIAMSTVESKASMAELLYHGENAKVGAVSQRPAEKATVAEPQRHGEEAKVGAELKRHAKASNLRPYVRSSTHKLRWTRELHHTFMNAVNELGGQNRATPKQILIRMGGDDVTIAQVKSHLQMLRLSKINADGMPVAAKVDPVVLNPIAVCKVVKPSLVSRVLDPLDSCAPLSVKEQREVFTALQLLKKGKMVPGPDGAQKLLQGLMDFDDFVHKAPSSDVGSVPTQEFIPLVDNNSDSLSGEKRKAEDDIALKLSIGTCLKGPKPNPEFGFPSFNTADESRLSLELALAIRSEKSR